MYRGQHINITLQHHNQYILKHAEKHLQTNFNLSYPFNEVAKKERICANNKLNVENSKKLWRLDHNRKQDESIDV
jgi:hypothetical protein